MICDTKISTSALGQAIHEINTMTVKEQEAYIDEIYSNHAIYIIEIVSHQRIGTDMEKIEVLLKCLMSMYRSYEITGVEVNFTSDAYWAHIYDKNVSWFKYYGSSKNNDLLVATEKQAKMYPQPVLLAYIIGEMVQHKFIGAKNESQLVLTLKTLVDCFSGVGTN